MARALSAEGVTLECIPFEQALADARAGDLVISDAHEGLQQAISTVLTGTAWQRCRVHFMRNVLATVPQGAREAIAAIVRTILPNRIMPRR